MAQRNRYWVVSKIRTHHTDLFGEFAKPFPYGATRLFKRLWEEESKAFQRQIVSELKVREWKVKGAGAGRGGVGGGDLRVNVNCERVDFSVVTGQTSFPLEADDARLINHISAIELESKCHMLPKAGKTYRSARTKAES